MARELRPEERAVWRKIAKTVTPIAPDRAAQLKAMEDPAPARPSARAQKQGESAAAKTGAASLPAAAKRKIPVEPVDRSAEKKVRRGRVDIGARIDLHGMTQDQALSALTRFLHTARRRGLKTVLVITGKGHMARPRQAEPWEYVEDPGVLRRRLPQWLSGAELRHLVSGYAQAHQRHGGAGAFYVTIRRL